MKNSLKVTPFSGKGMFSHKFLFLEKKIAKNCDEKTLLGEGRGGEGGWGSHKPRHMSIPRP
jgi:hypothetical protein